MDICGQNSAVSNMCRCAENALKGHTVSELPNQPSKHIHQLTSSASFLTKVQATTEPHTLFQQREKGSRLRPAKETHNHEKQICTNEHHRNTQTRIQLSLNQTFQSPEVPAKWWVPHRAVTVKHKKNKRLQVTARDVAKRKKQSHGKQSLNVMCNHVEQPGTPTATQQLACDGRQRPDKHTSHTLSQSNAHPHSHNATCKTEIENNMRAYNKTRNTWHTLEPKRR